MQLPSSGSGLGTVGFLIFFILQQPRSAGVAGY